MVVHRVIKTTAKNRRAMEEHNCILNKYFFYELNKQFIKIANNLVASKHNKKTATTKTPQ